MALFQITAGPKMGQLVLVIISGAKSPGIITKVNTDGTVNVSYFVDGSTSLSAASNLKLDAKGTVNNTWHWPQEGYV